MYTLFKFLHIAAAIVWIGGGFALGALQIRLVRSNEREAMRVASKHAEALGRALIGPSALLTLGAGIVMVATSAISFGAFWIVWGFAGIVASMILGGGVGLRLQGELNAHLAAEEPDVARVDALQKRLTLLHSVTILILFSVVWAMVAKPML